MYRSQAISISSHIFINQLVLSLFCVRAVVCNARDHRAFPLFGADFFLGHFSTWSTSQSFLRSRRETSDASRGI